MTEGPFIIKRKRIFSADSHHGGAWKVAYADFVTSMMAFFMLMWILNATTEQQRRGLADYFDPNTPISPVSGGGNDVLQGDSVFSTDTLLSDGHGGVADSQPSDKALAAQIDMDLKELQNQGDVRVTLSPEGVVIDLLDTSSEPIFRIGSANRTGRLEAILSRVAPSIAAAGRLIKVSGHTDDLQFSGADYTNWELSSDRANAARRVAISQGVPDRLFYEVSGQADRLPVSEDRSSPRNRRISIILLNPQSAPLNAY